MAKETGHAINVANFKTLVNHLEGLGTTYQPSKPALQITALKQLLAIAEADNANLLAVLPPYSRAVDEQEAVFKGLASLATRINNAFGAIAESEEAAHTVIALKKSLTGSNKKTHSGEQAAKIAVDGKETGKHSTSQLSYDNRVQHFQQLVETVADHPGYSPNETELQVNSLTTHAHLLKQKTEAVDKVYQPVLKARIERDKTLYTENTGIIDTVKATKKYLRSIYKPKSPELKFVTSLQFRKKKK